MRLLSFIIILFSLGCSKEVPVPQVSFTATETIEGSVNFKSTSSNADSYLWDFGDGYSIDAELPSHFYPYNGIYVVTLKVKGKGGESTVKQDIKVTTILGEAMFWMRSKGEKNVLVVIDGGVYLGNINFAHTSEPECQSGGAITYSRLTDGEHTYRAKEESGTSPREWSGTVRVIGRKCAKKELVY